MKHRLFVIAILGIVIAAALLLLHSRPGFLDVVLRIEYKDRDATLHMLDVTSEGKIYALLETQNDLQLRGYNSKGKLVSLSSVADIAFDRFDAVILSSEGLMPSFTLLGEHQPSLRTLRLKMNRDCKVLEKPEYVLLEYVDDSFSILPADEAIYMAGSNLEDNSFYRPTVTKIDYSGTCLWKQVERSDSFIAGPVTVDNDGNVILTGDIGAGVGLYLVKYSASGKRLWKIETKVLDGTQAIWVQTDRQGRIYAIYALHTGIMAHSGDDMSGRNQDFVLFIYSPEGKLLKKQVLSHGAWLDIVDAAINKKGEVIALGNRRKTTLLGYPKENENAQLIKCDANGNIVWSRAVRLSSGYLATGIRLDEKGGIYILSIGGDGSYEKAFVYKVMSPG